ncbi:DUF2798 domain-containing protein [Chitinibacter sp. S2-10]|uniref:DUF2798 domain-containing protein n=1 Tax=Chitinibacter sp. S2-10 TaxID=3373597 RepID=UPI0039776491
MNPVSSPLRLRKLPARYAAVVLPFFLSILMTCIVSFVSTLKGVGWAAGIPRIWLISWGFSWLVAFPTLLLVLPLVRKLTSFVVESV